MTSKTRTEYADGSNERTNERIHRFVRPKDPNYNYTGPSETTKAAGISYTLAYVCKVSQVLGIVTSLNHSYATAAFSWACRGGDLDDRRYNFNSDGASEAHGILSLLCEFCQTKIEFDFPGIVSSAKMNIPYMLSCKQCGRPLWQFPGWSCCLFFRTVG